MDFVYPRPGAGYRGPPLEPGPGAGHHGERLVAGPSPMGPGRAQPEEVTWVPLRTGPPPVGGAIGVGCSVPWAAAGKLALGTWNVTSPAGKEPELVCEAERFRLDIVGLASTHSSGSGTSLLERGWTLCYSGVAPVAVADR
ncbi:unnamed protein product [Menidia menidia]|uniref:(Atlantic silverside) hypothetical protein n=1 Tax=Menidia menidia TaxID=238744 RepID=A0A8S4AEE6_9TELE|nr:unnamed protein product [Menidia menidia]